jgi:hypothetical protein
VEDGGWLVPRYLAELRHIAVGGFSKGVLCRAADTQFLDPGAQGARVEFQDHGGPGRPLDPPAGLLENLQDKLLHTLAVHWVDLHKLHRLLPQKVQQWLCVRPCGLKANQYLSQSMGFFKPAQLLPKLVKTIPAISDLKGVLLFPVWGAEISKMRPFTDIQADDHCLPVDPFNFLRFSIHGYTPLLIPDYQPNCL